MPIGKRNVFLDGVPGSTDREERGVKDVRGEVAVARLRAEIERYADILRRAN